MAITRNLVVMLKDDVAKPKEKMFIYRDDVGVEMVIELKDFDYSIDTVGNRNNIQKAYALFRTPTKKTYQYTNIKISNGKLVFTFSQDIINVMQEIGEYELQFQLYDKEDNRLTIPSYNFYVKEPLTIDGELVDTAVVDESVIIDLGEEQDYIFVITDGYIKTKWRTGDLITKERLNKVENALSVITDAVNSKVGISQLHNHENKEILDTISANKINEWDNKSNFDGDYNSLTNKPTIPSLNGYATEQYVNEEIKKIDVTEQLTDYAKKSDLEVKADKSYVDSAIESVDVSSQLTNYATKSELLSKVDKVTGKSLISDSEIERLSTLSNYDDTDIKNTLNSKANKTDLHSHTNKTVLDGITSAKVNEWNNKSTFDGNYNNLTNKPTIPTKTSQLTNDSGFMTTVPSEYITETELNAKGYLTQHQDISHKVDKINGYSLVSDTEISKLATLENYDDTEVRELIDETNASLEQSVTFEVVGEGTTVPPLDNVVGNIPTKTSQLINDSGFITSIPSEYVTETELSNKGYLTQHQDLSSYAKKTDLHSHSNKSVLDGITADKITEWDNKSTFDGNYNSLTNKPTIPTKTSQLTNDSNYITSIPSEYVTESKLTSELDKVAVFVTPQMYGAVGDGEHDDTVAFQQAIAENDSVFVPSGTYLIKDSLNVSYKKSIITDNGQMAKIIFDCDDPSKPVFYIGRNTTISGFFIQPQKIMTEAVIWHDNTKYLKDTGSNSCGSMIENIRLLMKTESPDASFIRITMNSDTTRPSGCCYTTFKDIQVDSSCQHYGNGIYLELVQNKEFTEENKAGFPWITHIIFDNIYLGAPYTGIKSRVVVKEGLTRFNRCSMGFIHMNNVSTQNLSLEKTRYYLDVEHIELYMTRCIGWDYHHVTNNYKLKVNRIGEGAKLLISDSWMSFGQPLLDCCEFPTEDGTKTVTTAPAYFIEKYFKGTILNEGYDTIDAKIDSKFNTNTFEDIVDTKINEVLYQPITNIMKDPRTSVVRDQYYSASSNGYKNQPGSDLLSIRFPIVSGTNVVRWSPVVVPNDGYCGVYIFPDNTFTNGVFMGSSYSTDSKNLYDAETNSITINNSYNYQYACIVFDYTTLTDIDNFFMTINRDISNNTQTYTEFINETLIEPKINSIEIPTKISELENDKGYITNSQIKIDNIDGEKVTYTNSSGAEYTITITDTGLPTAKPKGYYEGNWVLVSTDENGNIYNGNGYLFGYRLNSSGNIVEASTSCVSGFIPVTVGDTIIIGNSSYQTPGASGHYVAFYDENKQLLKVDTYENVKSATGNGSYYQEGDFYKFQFKISAYSNEYKTFINKIKYIRVSMMQVTETRFDIRITREIGGITRPVETVNGKNGVVLLKTSDLENDSGYLTQHQDISGKADKTELHNHNNKSVLDEIKTETWTFTLADGSTVTKKVVLV